MMCSTFDSLLACEAILHLLKFKRVPARLPGYKFKQVSKAKLRVLTLLQRQIPMLRPFFSPQKPFQWTFNCRRFLCQISGCFFLELPKVQTRSSGESGVQSLQAFKMLIKNFFLKNYEFKQRDRNRICFTNVAEVFKSEMTQSSLGHRYTLGVLDWLWASPECAKARTGLIFCNARLSSSSCRKCITKRLASCYNGRLVRFVT